MIRPRESGRDGKQRGQKNQTYQQDAPLYISRYDMLGFRDHTSKDNSAGGVEQNGFVEGGHWNAALPWAELDIKENAPEG